jgi:hypothetical protein
VSKKQKLTPWLPVHVKPVRVGIYQVELRPEWGNDGFSYFDGSRFNAVYSQPDWAYADREFEGCGVSVIRWRGLAEQPK